MKKNSTKALLAKTYDPDNNRSFFKNDIIHILIDPIFIIGLFSVIAILLIFSLGLPYFFAPIIAIFVPLSIFFYRYPEFLYYPIVIMIPLDAVTVLSQKLPSLTIGKVSGSLLAFVFIIKIFFNKNLICLFKSNIWKLIFIFTIVLFFSTAISPYLYKEIPFLRKFIQTILFTILTQYIIVQRYSLNNIEKMIIFGTSISSLIGIYGFIFNVSNLILGGNGPNDTRALGGSNDPNALAVSILFGLPFVFYYIIKSKKAFHRLFWLSILIINISGIILSYSRAGILILVFLLFYLFFELLKFIKKKYLFLILLSLLPLSVVTIYTLPQTKVYERMQTLTKGDTSLSRRASYYVIALKSFLERPFFGWGLNGYPNLYAKSTFPTAFVRGEPDKARYHIDSYYRAPHNSYIDVIVSTGIIGFAVFSLLIFSTIKKFYSKLNPTDLLLNLRIKMYICSFISILIGLAFISNIYHKFIWLIIGIALSLNSGKKNFDEFKKTY